MAVEKGNIEIVRLLLNHNKIDVNSRMKFKLIKRLLKIDLQKTALQIAIQNKDVEIVKLLLEQPSISINERVPYKLDREPKGAKCYDYDGNEIPNEDTNNERRHDDCLKTPLHVAIQTGCIEIIKLLLENKSINVNIPDGQGKLPIDYTNNPEIKALFPKT